METTQTDKITYQESYLLNDLIGAKVMLHGKKIGRLADIVVKENGKLPLVTHFYVSRLFGSPSLLVPWENVLSVTKDEIVIRIDNPKDYEKEPSPDQIKLKDHILDKKILDTEDREIDVVYDIRLVMLDDKMYVSDVDISNTGLLRRIKLGFLASFIESRFGKDRKKMIHWRYLQHLPTPLGRFKGDVKLNILKEKLSEVHPADLADILEELDLKQRISVIEELDTQKASQTLEEIDPRVQREIIASMKKEKIVQLLNHMTSGQVADILSALPHANSGIILDLLDERTSKKVKSILNKQEEDILNYATTKIIKVYPSQLIEEIRMSYYHLAKDKKIVTYLYAVDDKDRLIGVIGLKALLSEDGNKRVKDVMIDELISLTPMSTLREALNTFERYDIRALPILDKEGKILGVISYRDIKKLKHKFLE